MEVEYNGAKSFIRRSDLSRDRADQRPERFQLGDHVDARQGHRPGGGLVAVADGENLFIAAGTNGTTGTITVSGAVLANSITFDDPVDVTISVTRSDPSRPAVCIVRARSKDGSETGRRELLVGPSDQSTVQVTAQVKTSRPPVNGDIYGCGNDVPDYLVGS